MSAFRLPGTERVFRRLLHGYWRFSRGLTLGVRAMVIDGEDRVFLVKHGYVTGWHLPGGGVERGETVRQALRRELREEANIEVIDPPLLHGVFLNAAVSRRDHIALFVVRGFRQETLPQPSYEIIDHRFFGLAELPADVTPGTRRRIAEVLEGASVSEKW
jgi:8-oxo-dGTP pyrophosphatase MutT (NUDIX family)